MANLVLPQKPKVIEEVKENSLIDNKYLTPF